MTGLIDRFKKANEARAKGLVYSQRESLSDAMFNDQFLQKQGAGLFSVISANAKFSDLVPGQQGFETSKLSTGNMPASITITVDRVVQNYNLHFTVRVGQPSSGGSTGNTIITFADGAVLETTKTNTQKSTTLASTTKEALIGFSHGKWFLKQYNELILDSFTRFLEEMESIFGIIHNPSGTTRDFGNHKLINLGAGAFDSTDAVNAKQVPVLHTDQNDSSITGYDGRGKKTHNFARTTTPSGLVVYQQLVDSLAGKEDKGTAYIKAETYSRGEIDTKLGGKADTGDSWLKSEAYPKTQTYSSSEIDTKLGGKADTGDSWLKSEAYSIAQADVAFLGKRSAPSNAWDAKNITITNLSGFGNGVYTSSSSSERGYAVNQATLRFYTLTRVVSQGANDLFVARDNPYLSSSSLLNIRAADPLVNEDLATKKYVDDEVRSGGSAGYTQAEADAKFLIKPTTEAEERALREQVVVWDPKEQEYDLSQWDPNARNDDGTLGKYVARRMASVGNPTGNDDTEAANVWYVKNWAIHLTANGTAWDGKNKPIKNVAHPTDLGDVLTLGRGNALYGNPISLSLRRSDSSSPYSAGNIRITNVATPTANSDAATKEYVDTNSSSGSGQYDFSNAKGINLAPGTADKDAVNYKQLTDGLSTKADAGVLGTMLYSSSITKAVTDQNKHGWPDDDVRAIEGVTAPDERGKEFYTRLSVEIDPNQNYDDNAVYGLGRYFWTYRLNLMPASFLLAATYKNPTRISGLKNIKGEDASSGQLFREGIFSPFNNNGASTGAVQIFTEDELWTKAQEIKRDFKAAKGRDLTVDDVESFGMSVKELDFSQALAAGLPRHVLETCRTYFMNEAAYFPGTINAAAAELRGITTNKIMPSSGLRALGVRANWEASGWAIYAVQTLVYTNYVPLYFTGLKNPRVVGNNATAPRGGVLAWDIGNPNQTILQARASNNGFLTALFPPGYVQEWFSGYLATEDIKVKGAGGTYNTKVPEVGDITKDAYLNFMRNQAVGGTARYGLSQFYKLSNSTGTNYKHVEFARNFSVNDLPKNVSPVDASKNNTSQNKDFLKQLLSDTAPSFSGFLWKKNGVYRSGAAGIGVFYLLAHKESFTPKSNGNYGPPVTIIAPNAPFDIEAQLKLELRR